MNIFESFFRRAEQRRAYEQLSQLDDHLLRDIGIVRGNLHHVVRSRNDGRTRG